MNHRHLLPTEIDLLLDDEEGFGVAPLKAHVRDCLDCQSRLEEARFVADALEELPRFAPSHAFADKVMADVAVYVPWHEAGRDAVKRWIPQSRSMRLVAVGLATSFASLITLAVLWAATRTDLLVFATGVAGGSMRQIVDTVVREALVSLFGVQALAVVTPFGLVGLLVILVGFLAAAFIAALGLRAIAVASSRRRV